jgi:hypothetical protein
LPIKATPNHSAQTIPKFPKIYKSNSATFRPIPLLNDLHSAKALLHDTNNDNDTEETS